MLMVTVEFYRAIQKQLIQKFMIWMHWLQVVRVEQNLSKELVSENVNFCKLLTYIQFLKRRRDQGENFSLYFLSFFIFNLNFVCLKYSEMWMPVAIASMRSMHRTTGSNSSKRFTWYDASFWKNSTFRSWISSGSQFSTR